MSYHQSEEQQYNFNSGGGAGGSGDFNYYSQPAQPEYPGQFSQGSQPQYPQAQTSSLSPPNQYAFSGSAGNNNMQAFDNVDISRGGGGNFNKFSGGTPFETVQEFVSVSNKVTCLMVLFYHSHTCFRNFKIFWILLLLTLDHVGLSLPSYYLYSF